MNFFTLNPLLRVLNNNMPFGYKAGSGASKSTKLLVNNATMVAGSSLSAPEVPYLASANMIPFSVV